MRVLFLNFYTGRKHQSMPVRDMGYQHAKYREQIRSLKEKNRKAGLYPSALPKELRDGQKLYPVITVILNYSQKKWENPVSIKDMLSLSEKYLKDIEPWLADHRIHVVNLADQPEDTMRKYRSDFRYLVRYLACHNDRKKLENYFRTTEFRLDHPEAFLDWLSAVTNDRRYRTAKELIERKEKGGRVDMCVLLDMYEERGEERGLQRGIKQGKEEGKKEGRREGRREGRKEGRREGRKEGIRRGREEGRCQLIRMMLQRNHSPEEISEWTGENLSYVKEVEKEM